MCNHFFSYFKIFLFRKYLFSKNLISLWDFFFIIISISDSEIGKFSRRIQLLSWPKDPWYFIVKNLNIHKDVIELMINKLHGLSPSGGLVSPSSGFASLLFDQVEYFASIKLLSKKSPGDPVPVLPGTRVAPTRAGLS